MLNNDVIAWDVGDVGKAKDEGDKEVGKGNKGATAKRDQENGEVDQAGNGGDQKTG